MTKLTKTAENEKAKYEVTLTRKVKDEVADFDGLKITTGREVYERLEVKITIKATGDTFYTWVGRDRSMLLQETKTLHDFAEGRLPAAIFPVSVVNLLRTVDADADKEAVPFQKSAPFIGNQRAVRLHHVFDSFSISEWLLHLNRLLEKLNPQKHGLPALPDEFHFRRGLGGYIPGDVCPQDFIRHAIIFIPGKK